VLLRGGAYIFCCKKGVGGAGKKLELFTTTPITYLHPIPHTIRHLQQKKHCNKKPLFTLAHCFPSFTTPMYTKNSA
jgi:hypothetical protein